MGLAAVTGEPLDLEAEIAALYGLTPDAFVPARDALAKRARAEGGKPAADRVKALRRPVAAIWAVNQLWRRDPARFQRLLELGDRVRAVQAARDRPHEALGEALSEQRACVRELLDEAARILSAAGFAVDPNLERVRSNLAALSAWGTDLPVSPGRLHADVEPPGFEALLRVAPRRDAGPAVGPPAKQAPRPPPPALRLVGSAPEPARAAPKPPPGPSPADLQAHAAAREEVARRQRELERAIVQVEAARERLEAAEARTARARDELARREADEQELRDGLRQREATRDEAARGLSGAETSERAAARRTR